MMSWLTKRVVRGLRGRLADVHQYLHLVFGTSTYRAPSPSDHTVHAAHCLFDLLEQRARGDNDPGDVERVSAILEGCTDLHSLLVVCDVRGYNVLQLAVLHADHLLLKVLIDEGVQLDRGSCTLPLHLACKLGQLELVRFLIEQGADASVEIGMCYPAAHIPIKHVPSRFHFLETDIFACDSNHQLPLMYAIHNDHLEVVRYLIEGASPRGWPLHRYPLHCACRHGAYSSMCYLAQYRPAALNETDLDGMTPLLHGVPWGKRFVEFLEAHGANIHCVTPGNQTALHVLFLQVEDPSELSSTTKFLLGSGLEQDVNVVDSSGNSPLHMLVTQVNHNIASFPRSGMEHFDQTAFDSHVLQTLDLVLSHNCDPNIVNRSGVTALHKLILMFDFVISNDPTGITLETLPVRERYRVDLDVLHDAMAVLLRHGADPNAMTGAGRSTLVMLLHTMFDVSPHKLPQYRDGFFRCLSLLCSHGAQPSFSVTTHAAVISSITKFGQKCLQERTCDMSVKNSLSSFLQDILALLLQHGLDSNYSTELRVKEQVGGSGNLLVELVKLAAHIRQPSDLDLIRCWVLTSLQWGANPDLEPYPTDPIICHSQSSIFLKPKATQAINQYMYQIQDIAALFEDGPARDLLLLFYNSMDHTALYQCLHAAKFLSRFDPHSTKIPSNGFLHMVNKLSCKPRTLQQMSRVAVYKAMCRQLTLRTPHLPLPPPLKNYILNVL